MRRFLAAVLAAGLFLSGTVGADYGADEKCLSVCDDLYIDEHTPQTNYESSDSLYIQNIGSSKYNREAWLRFDMSEIKAPERMKIESAVLSVYAASNHSSDKAGVTSDGIINLWSLSKSDYDAKTVTYGTENRPVRKNIIASSMITAKSSFKAGYINFDISEYIRTTTADGKIAVSIYPGEYKIAAPIKSSESAYPPKLTVKYSVDYSKTIVSVPKADTCVSSDEPDKIFGKSEDLNGNALFSFYFGDLGEDEPCVTDFDGYTAVDITEYLSEKFLTSKTANLYITGENFSVNSRESSENKPYIKIELSDNSVKSAILYLYGNVGNIGIYELSSSFSENETCYGNMPKTGAAVKQGGSGKEFNVTYNGYTQEELENTYYMKLDDGTAYPSVEDVYDISQIPSESEITAELSKLSHPYIIANESDFERIKNLKSDKYISKWYADIETSGEKYLASQATEYNVSSGSLSSNIDEAAMTLAFLYNTCDDTAKKEEYAKKAVYYLKAAAEYPDFNPQKMLNVGEMSRGMGVAYDWMYNYMSESDRKIIENTIIEKSLKPVLSSPNKNSNNWNFVVNGGALVAAAAVGKSDLSAAVIKQSAQLLPRAMRLYYPDGVFIEASGYFEYASDYLASALSALDTAFGTDWGISGIKGFDKSGYYPIYTRGYNNSQAISYGDGDTTAVSSPLLLWMAEKFNNSDYGMYQRDMDGNDIFSVIWYNPNRYAKARTIKELPLDYYADGISPFVSFKSGNDDENGLFAGMKGGFNQMSHGDLDIGNFYIGAYGKNFTAELSGVDYHKSTDGLPAYFRLSRYEYYSKSPQGHNTLLINPQSDYPDMSFGQELAAHCGFTDYKSGDECSYSILDMTSAYSKKAQKVLRGMKMDRTNNSIIISDKITPKQPSDIWWFMHTDADISVDGSRAALTIDGKKLYAHILGDSDAEFRVMSENALNRTPTVKGFDDVQYINRKKLAVYIPYTTETELQICFSTEDSDAEFVPLDKWNSKAEYGHTMLSKTIITEITASDDTNSDQPNPDKPFGNDNAINIKYSGTTYNREGFLKFNTSGITADKLQRVVLRVHAIRNYREPRREETLSLYEVSDNWDENTLTWNNKPEISKDSLICTANVTQYNENTSVVNEDVEFDITDYYLSKENKNSLSFAIKLTSRKEGNVVIASKESGYAPVIIAENNTDEVFIDTGENYADKIITVCEKENGVIKNLKTYLPSSEKTKVAVYDNATDVYVWSKSMVPSAFWTYISEN